MSGFVFAVALCLVSAVAYAGGAILQERVADGASGGYALARRPVWWGAVGLNGVGALLHVVALAYGPLSLVQPLGALTIVFALPMAAVLMGRTAGPAAWRGALMATVGLAGMLALTGAGSDRAMTDGERLALAVLTVVVLVTLTLAARTAHRRPVVRGLLLAGGAGVAFGVASVFTKALAVEWTDGVGALDLPNLAVVALLATVGMTLSQSSYRGAGLAAPLSTVTVVNPAVAAAVGLTLLGEAFRFGTTGTLLALGCGVVAAGGLILLTTERIEREGPTPEGTEAGTRTGTGAEPPEAVTGAVSRTGAPGAVRTAGERDARSVPVGGPAIGPDGSPEGPDDGAFDGAVSGPAVEPVAGPPGGPPGSPGSFDGFPVLPVLPSGAPGVPAQRDGARERGPDVLRLSRDPVVGPVRERHRYRSPGGRHRVGI
ncbi:DMT family transporter [Streptomyces sp. JNUCC 64]